MKLDPIDLRLINMLQADCKRPIKELASALNLSIAPVHERIKKIERAGYIKRYVAIVDIEKINRPFVNYCNVSIVKHSSAHFKEFEKQIRKMDEVLECSYVSGNFDYLLKVITANMNEYQDFIMNKLSKLEMIANINSQSVMKSVKFRTAVNV